MLECLPWAAQRMAADARPRPWRGSRSAARCVAARALETAVRFRFPEPNGRFIKKRVDKVCAIQCAAGPAEERLGKKDVAQLHSLYGALIRPLHLEGGV